MIVIDGSKGEGGGQVLRTSLSLSTITGKPFTIRNIRAGRRKPGLMRQHLTAVQAATQIAQAETQGAAVGSTELTFIPNGIQGGDYEFSVGTAGSTTLVFQTILPALAMADRKSTLILNGGTHNPMAPPFTFLEKTFLPIINTMGPKVEASLKEYGFYPAGGGRFECTIEPVRQWNAIYLVERGAPRTHTAEVLLSNLPEQIGVREIKHVQRKLNWTDDQLSIRDVPSKGPGNTISIQAEYENITETFTGFGEVRRSAENVAKRVINEYQYYTRGEHPVGSYLADQLLLPLALAGRGEFYTGRLTNHASTQIELIQEFLGIDFKIQETDRGIHIALAP